MGCASCYGRWKEGVGCVVLETKAVTIISLLWQVKKEMASMKRNKAPILPPALLAYLQFGRRVQKGLLSLLQRILKDQGHVVPNEPEALLKLAIQELHAGLFTRWGHWVQIPIYSLWKYKWEGGKLAQHLLSSYNIVKTVKFVRPVVVAPDL